MARLDILEYPDPRLRLSAETVTRFDAELGRFVRSLAETLRESGAIGLAAPQVDDRRRVLAVDLSQGAEPVQIYVNPQILDSSAFGLVEESCLSVPDVVGTVVRATQVRVRAQDESGAIFERDLEGMDAVCLQHEMDHLDGRLFIDRLSFFRRLRYRAERYARRRRGAAA